MEIVKPMKENTPDFVCGNCPHWFKRNDLSKPSNAIGDCRLKPAQVHFLPTMNSLGVQGIGMQTHFPLHQEAAWCGEHPGRKAEVAAAYVLDALTMMQREPELFKAILLFFKG